MRLSEAIRLGAMLRPQGYGPLSATGEIDATCAIGAAAEACGITGDSEGVYYKLNRCWPWLFGPMVSSPVDGSRDMPMDVIWKLNDNAQWTREQIADWVATIEPTEPEAVPQVDHPTAVETRR